MVLNLQGKSHVALQISPLNRGMLKYHRQKWWMHLQYFCPATYNSVMHSAVCPDNLKSIRVIIFIFSSKPHKPHFVAAYQSLLRNKWW